MHTAYGAPMHNSLDAVDAHGSPSGHGFGCGSASLTASMDYVYPGTASGMSNGGYLWGREHRDPHLEQTLRRIRS